MKVVKKELVNDDEVCRSWRSPWSTCSRPGEPIQKSAMVEHWKFNTASAQKYSKTHLKSFLLTLVKSVRSEMLQKSLTSSCRILTGSKQRSMYLSKRQTIHSWLDCIPAFKRPAGEHNGAAAVSFVVVLVCGCCCFILVYVILVVLTLVVILSQALLCDRVCERGWSHVPHAAAEEITRGSCQVRKDSSIHNPKNRLSVSFCWMRNTIRKPTSIEQISEAPPISFQILCWRDFLCPEFPAWKRWEILQNEKPGFMWRWWWCW